MMLPTRYYSVRYDILPLNRAGGSNGFIAFILLPRALPCLPQLFGGYCYYSLTRALWATRFRMIVR
ncbi:MAG TPA: hypothetical protein PLK12_16175 [Prolixibacteraceae bacterium]|nr:hypothetical protein [Prolixibacteraceae bacterium]